MRPDARLKSAQEREGCERFSVSHRLAAFVVDARESGERVNHRARKGGRGEGRFNALSRLV